MNARRWFNEALAAESKAYRAKTEAERRRHGQNAIDALLVAVSLGSHDAYLQLGVYYRDGEFGILPARADLAEHWFRLAVTANDGTGMMALGTLLMGTGRQVEGQRWLRKALAHGDGAAACHLGGALEATSPSRALRLYLQGAALGDPFAALCAGKLLEARGTPKALLQAEALFRQAARKELQGADEDLERVRRKAEEAGLRHPKLAGRRRRP